MPVFLPQPNLQQNTSRLVMLTLVQDLELIISADKR